MHTHIHFRFRKELDDDLVKATSHLNKTEVNQLSRDGLRLMLGIGTRRVITIMEKPLVIPRQFVTDDTIGMTVPGKPAVFVPRKNGRD